MNFVIPDKELARIAFDPSYVGRYGDGIAAMFRQTLQIIAAVPDESVLFQFQCLRYRKVRGRRSLRRLSLTKDSELLVHLKNDVSKPELIVEQISCGRRKVA